MSFRWLGYCDYKDGVELIEGNHNPGYVSMEYFGEIGWYGNLKKYL